MKTKLLKRDRSELISILEQLNEGINFILEENTQIMRETSLTSNNIFTSKMSGKAYSSINKEIGSKLCYIWAARSKLTRFLFSEEEVR